MGLSGDVFGLDGCQIEHRAGDVIGTPLQRRNVVEFDDAGHGVMIDAVGMDHVAHADMTARAARTSLARSHSLKRGIPASATCGAKD
jgi:hypothetical protein